MREDSQTFLVLLLFADLDLNIPPISGTVAIVSDELVLQKTKKSELDAKAS